MKILKKLVDWFDDLLWKLAIEDVFSEYYFDAEDKDGDTKVSGGSHNYICYRIEEELCGQMEDKEVNDLIADIVQLVHDLEWYHSSDTSREEYTESVRAFKEKWFKQSRTQRLRNYVDKAVEELKEELIAMIGETDGADDSSRCCYSGVKCYADDCGTCKERADCFKEE